MVKEKTSADPYKVFKAIAEILSEQEGVKITLKSVRKKDEQKSA
ncbi:hypothetical protein [Anaerocolumna sp. MB42-C2]|nr:hypothetical protein [Anaerocolumna sp. MB42-C2]WMJ85460.1 hypothetical protein RBU59_15425 [Anaerocolumna sp. MB42-C2]